VRMTSDERLQVEIRRLQARVSTLEQLLEVYERSVIEQSDKLYAEQERLSLQTTLLASQGEASLDGILSASLDGRVLFANYRVSEMWGLDPPVTEAMRVREPLCEMASRCIDPEGFLERVDALGDEQASREEIALEDGRIFDRYTAPIRGQEGEMLGRVWHFCDISRLKEVGRLKDEFISAVSHELRTPLTSIGASLDLMANGVAGNLSGDSMSLTKIAQSNCKRLVRLINDVLDSEKIEAGKLTLRPEPVALESLVEKTVESMKLYGAKLGVAFRVESSIRGARVRADPDRLIQVVENLLSNAAKYGPGGETVRVVLSRGGDQLRVAVVDRGPGVAPALQERLFEKFARIDTPSRAGAEGTGLGLNIARAIVERLGGTIGVVSEPGNGSTFYFDLPEWTGSGAEPA
jgi:signal transduction histidine kinase